jgi:hypothetical protein
MSAQQEGVASEVCSDRMEPVRMPGGLPSTAGFLRLAVSGDLQIEFYDFSESAESSFGNDVATIYTVKCTDLPGLQVVIPIAPEGYAEGGDVRHALAAGFSDVLALVRWLKEQGIPVITSFESWA